MSRNANSMICTESEVEALVGSDEQTLVDLDDLMDEDLILVMSYETSSVEALVDQGDPVFAKAKTSSKH